MKNKLLLFFCCVCCCLSAGLISSVRADAAVYTSDDGLTVWGQLYEDYKSSGTGASVYGFFKQSVRYRDTNGILVEKWFMIPYYLNAEKCAKVVSCHYEYITDHSVWDTFSFSDAVFPALFSSSQIYTCSAWHSVDHGHPSMTVYTSYKGSGSNLDPGTFKFSCTVPVFETYKNDGNLNIEGFLGIYTYLATGIITDPSLVELPEGYTIDDNGKLQEVGSDVIFQERFSVSFVQPSWLWGLAWGNTVKFDTKFNKRIKDGYDKKMCFYKDCLYSSVGNNASCLYLYTEKTQSANHELIYCSYAFEKNLFRQLSHSWISDDGLSSDIYDIGGLAYFAGSPESTGSHGGGTFGEDSVQLREFFSKESICEDFPVLIDGVFCVDDESCVNFLRGVDNFIFANMPILGVFPSIEEYKDNTSSISAVETPDIARPVFSTKEAAAAWYQTSIVEDYHNDVVYKPEGYYYHKSTKILDMNPDEDVVENDEKEKNPYKQQTPDPTVDVSATVTSGSSVIVNVDVEQSNDNDLTAIATASAVSDVQVGSSGSGSEDGTWIPESDNDSLFDIVGDAVDDEDDDWTDMIRYAFSFLPVKIQELLSGSVIIGIIVGLLRRR